MPALVTGCAGFIGSHLAESLLADGHDVVGVDCFHANYGRAQKLANLERARSWDAFDFVPIDLARGDLEDLVDACDPIFHLAAEPGVRGSWGRRFKSYVRNNVEATQHLLEAAARRPGRRVVFASSSSVYGQAAVLPIREDEPCAPVSPYGVTKLAAERLCLAYRASFGLDVVLLRYFSVYGPRQRPDMALSAFCRALQEGRPPELYGSGAQTRDFTFVDDVVAATRAAAVACDAAGAVVNVGGGSRVALRDALELLASLAGRSLEVLETPAQPGDVSDTAADIALARSLLGFAPSVGLEEGLAAQWEWSLSSAQRVV